MSYKRLFPSTCIEPLAWLCRFDWIQIEQNRLVFARNKFPEILAKSRLLGTPFYRAVARLLSASKLKINEESLHYVITLFLASKSLGYGEKILRLSTERCEAYENTNANIPFRDYQQPYETMIVELPQDYAKSKIVADQSDYPDFIAIHHDAHSRLLVTQSASTRSEATVCNLLKYELDDTIETVLQQAYSNITPATNTSIYNDVPYLPIVFNAMLAMTYGKDWKEIQHSSNDTRHLKQFKQRLRLQNRVERIKGGIKLGSLPTYYVFDQNIKAFEDRQTYDTVIVRSGGAKKPHWRKGHWRRQPIGQGRNEFKWVWIKPILINSDRFVGDLKDTKTTYTS